LESIQKNRKGIGKNVELAERELKKKKLLTNGGKGTLRAEGESSLLQEKKCRALLWDNIVLATAFFCIFQ